MHVAIQRLPRVPELASERIRNVYAHTIRAVERTGQRLTLVPDARVLLGVLRVETEARLVHDM